MKNRLIFQNATYVALRSLMEKHPDEEDAAFFAYREYETDLGRTILIRDVIPIAEHNVIRRSRTSIDIEGRAQILAMHEARLLECSLGFIHSHPTGGRNFSHQDDENESGMAKTALTRLRDASTFTSLIWCDGFVSDGRAWNRNGIWRAIEHVNVVGETLNFYSTAQGDYVAGEAYDRQRDILPWRVQRALGRLNIGIVGAGGTGSAVISQIARLGVGELTIVDGDHFESSNANRVHGSAIADQGLPKVGIAERLVRSMGLGTKLRACAADVDRREVAAQLRDCDIIFGCTDDQLGRSVLSRLSYAYLIPLFDMGVSIATNDPAQLSVDGRVTTLLPGEACLLCRERINAEDIYADTLRKYRPDEAKFLEREGYIREAQNRAPSVVMFTTLIASIAINEFLHRLIELYGEDRRSSEVLYRITGQSIRTNRKSKKDGCFCSNPDFVGFGDMQPFLDRTWPEHA